MKGMTFKKGIHPTYHKEITSNVQIEVMLPGKEVVFPMSQHIGASCTPVVKKGDYVYVGDQIGIANGFVSANIHSSISGTVKVIEKRMTVKGVKETCVVVENDGLYAINPEKQIMPYNQEEKLTRDILIEYVKAAGIVGLGGATFPTHVKLSTPQDKKVEFILINGAECEPYLTSDERVMLERGEDVIEGVKLLLQVFKEARVIIGIEDNKID